MYFRKSRIIAFDYSLVESFYRVFYTLEIHSWVETNGYSGDISYIENALKHLKNIKAPGLNGIPLQLLIEGQKEWRMVKRNYLTFYNQRKGERKSKPSTHVAIMPNI